MDLENNRLLVFLRRVFTVGQGRPVAIAFLVWLVFLNLASEPAFTPLSGPSPVAEGGGFFANPMKSGRQLLFDAYQRKFPRQPQSQPVTIVEIDEESLAKLGQWPWPRNRMAALIDTINTHRPLAIGLDVFMPEADQTSPDRVAANLPPGNEALARALLQSVRSGTAPNHDRLLAEAIGRAPMVLGVHGLFDPVQAATNNLRSVPPVAHGDDPLPFLANYPYALASLIEFQAAAKGQAYLSLGLEEGIVRRLPLVYGFRDQLVPGLAMEMLRVASASSAVEIHVGRQGLTSVDVADLQVPTQANGEYWLHFAPAAQTRDRNVSALDVLEGRIDPERFTDKLVLIGFNAAGLNDMKTTALGELVPGIEIHAQVIETLLERHLLLRPPWLKWVETLALLAMGGLMIWLIPRAESRFTLVLRTVPRVAMGLTLVINLIILAGGYGLFLYAGLLFDGVVFLIVLSGVMGCLVSTTLIEIDRQMKALADERQHLREEAAQLAGELAAARRIQLGSLPRASEVFPRENRFQIATLLEPARDVGGDLYDFFMIDERRLCFIVGDVSGKGVPASLFMAVTKTLAKSIALRAAEGPAGILTQASRELTRENPEMLFVTLLLGILDVESGQLSLANAGHENPWYLRPDGSVVQLPCPRELSGPPLCVVDDFSYRDQSVSLAPGDTLCLITDGITDASNEAGRVFGQERLVTALRTARGEAPAHVVHTLREHVRSFVGQAEAADDLTVLVLRWGKASGEDQGQGQG